MNQFLNPARAPAISTPEIPNYLVGKLNREWRERLTKAVKVAGLKIGFSDPKTVCLDLGQEKIGRLRSGAAIRYKTKPYAKRWLKGVLIKRSGYNLAVACVTRIGVFHLVQLTRSHPDWQNYFSGVQIHRLDRLEGQFSGNQRLKNLFALMRKKHAGWKLSDSGLEAELSLLANGIDPSRSESEAIANYMNILRRIPTGK